MNHLRPLMYLNTNVIADWVFSADDFSLLPKIHSADEGEVCSQSCPIKFALVVLAEDKHFW